MSFPFQRVLVPLGLSAFVVLAVQVEGWASVALVGGGLLMWMLLHFTRLITVLMRAADRPKGYVDSAVMLNAKLRTGVNLLHVMALTRSLGEQRSEPGADPEVFSWADSGGSEVTCTFVNGRLKQWALQRPLAETATEVLAPTPDA